MGGVAIHYGSSYNNLYHSICTSIIILIQSGSSILPTLLGNACIDHHLHDSKIFLTIFFNYIDPLKDLLILNFLKLFTVNIVATYICIMFLLTAFIF